MTIEKAQEISKLLDEKGCLEMAVNKLDDYLRIRVEIGIDNPSPCSAWVRDYTGEFMTEDVIGRMEARIAEIDKVISEM